MSNRFHSFFFFAEFCLLHRKKLKPNLNPGYFPRQKEVGRVHLLSKCVQGQNKYSIALRDSTRAVTFVQSHYSRLAAFIRSNIVCWMKHGSVQNNAIPIHRQIRFATTQQYETSDCKVHQKKGTSSVPTCMLHFKEARGMMYLLGGNS